MRSSLIMLGLTVPFSVSAQDIFLDFLYTIEAPANVTNFGRNVAVIADTNGDTFPEIAVAASSSAGGAILLYSSLGGSLIGRFDSPQEAPFIDFVEMDTFGRSLSIVPDANGDGIPDLAIAAPHHTAPGAGTLDGIAGIVYILDPTDMSIIRILTSPSAIRDGEFGFAVEGFQAAGPGAIPGIIVGAPKEAGQPFGFFSNTQAGRAHAFNVATGEHIHTFINPSELSEAEATQGHFGHAVAATSLFTGQVDFWVTEPGANFSSDTFVNTGRLYQYGGFSQNFLARNPLRIVTDSRFGESMSLIPFLNGEGSTADASVIVGHENNFAPDPTQNFGSAQAVGDGLNRDIPAPVLRTNTAFARAVAGVLDITGDNRGDYLIGHQRLTVGEEPELLNLAGLVHVYNGFLGTLLTSLPRPEEPQERGQFGAGISGSRDQHQAFQPFPRRRLAIGAPGTGFPESPAALVYVYKMRTRRTGDLNNDFQVNQTDINIMQNFLAGGFTIDRPDILDVLDINNDGVIDENDLDALNILVFGPSSTEATGWVVH